MVVVASDEDEAVREDGRSVDCRLIELPRQPRTRFEIGTEYTRSSSAP